MNLLQFPNKSLSTKCLPVTEFNEELYTILDGMKTIMIDNKGIGLSANQVGIHKRIMVLQNMKNETFELINPEIIDIFGEATMSEGCLSATGIFLNITRASQVMFQYQNRTGEIKKAMAEGVEARTILHEMDHLNGIFYFSKVNRQQRKSSISKLKKSK